MKNTKTEFKFFTVPEWEKEEVYLRKQHQNGWKFTGINFPLLYHFEKCEPEDVVYQLDYNQEGISNKEEYVKMFNDCGWEYMQDFAGYSYFRKPVSEMNGEEEIFCDNSSRADMMKRVFIGRMTPLLSMFFLVIIPNIYMQSQYNTLTNQILFGFFIVMFIIYLYFFVRFGIKYYQYLHR